MIYSSLSCDELVRACAEGNAEAWEEFVRRFGPVINAAIWRVVLRHGEYDPALVEDLVQDTFFKLCANNFRVLQNFKPQHENAFYGMAGKIATNVARDHYRPFRPPVTDDDISKLEDFLADPRASGSDYLERRLLVDKIDCIVRAHCSARDREIFLLYYGAMGLTAAEIARMRRFLLNEKGVESVLHRLKSLLREKLVELEKV